MRIDKSLIKPGMFLVSDSGGPVMWAKDYTPPPVRQPQSMADVGKMLDAATQKARALAKAIREAKRR